ncbi:hypothetical protein C8R45DRAFT_1221124 [Mycena sanguinolenta]|nr:hypothetical protein C8R45DRAFT_1221124 [Mycena sanguinolenta]
MRPSLLSTFTSRIEIERKFHPTRILLNALTRPTPTAPNPSLPASIAEIVPADVHFVRDVYYDKPDGRFVKAGVWVRRRSLFFPADLSGPTWSLFPEKDTETSSWEAKVRVGGDFAASQFVEVQGAEAVEEELLRVLGRTSGRVDLDKSDRDLEVMCDLTTRRLGGTLLLNKVDDVDAAKTDAGPLDRPTLVIDQVVATPQADFSSARAELERISTDIGSSSSPAAFFHQIGELEVMEDVLTHDAIDEEVHLKHRKHIASTCASQLEAFMRAHSALFPMEPKPTGKLEAYFRWAEAAKQQGPARRSRSSKKNVQ